MAWCGGFVVRDHSRDVRIPTTASLLRDGEIGLWIAGNEPRISVRIVGDHDRWVAVVGNYTGSDGDLRRLAEKAHQHTVFTTPGSYTVIVRDGDSVRISTDIANTRPIYVVDTEFGVVWSSRSRDLTGLLGCEIDCAWLSAFLYAPDVEPALASRSAFAGIAMVEPGQWLDIDSTHTTTSPAWTPTPRTLSQATRQLATSLAAGVAARIQSDVDITADCSGGLDSTTLTFLALNHADNSERLTAVTFHPRDVTTGGDLDYVHDALSAQPQLRHQWIPLDDTHLPFTDIDTVPPSDEPAPTSAAYARMSTQFTAVRDLGSALHLTGDGGDTLLCAPLLYLADLLDTKHYADAYRHATGWARVRRVSPWPLLRDALAATRHSYGESLALLAQTFRRADPSNVVDTVDTPSAGWHHHGIAPWVSDAARHHTADLLMAAAHRAAPAALDKAGQLTLTALRTVGRTANSDIQIAEHNGIALHNPYLDPSVVDAVLSVPAWQWNSPQRYKPFLTQAFPGLLPRSIQTRSTKGSYDIDHYQGIHAHASLLHNLVDGELAALDLINPDPLHSAIDLAATGLPVNITSVERIATTESWLRAIRSAPSPQWRIHRQGDRP
jgi:asparagine synthase (glutamine-hydrolysing)